MPSFPLREPAEQLDSPQLEHRKFWRRIELGGRTVKAPGSPFGLQVTAASGNSADRGAGPMPLSGVRVLDFSWVIAGPTATRYLAAMGAEVIKIEAPGRGDPGRASELHTVLGQAKRSIVLDLKKPEAVAIARALAARCDVRGRKFRYGRHGQAGPRRRRSAGPQPRSALCLGLRPRANRAGGARRRLRHPLAMLCRFRRAQSPSRYSATGRARLARPDVRPDARFHRRRRAVAPAAGRRCRPDRFLDDRGDAVDDGRTAAGDPARGPAAAARQRFRPSRPARRLPLRRRGRLDQPRHDHRRGVAKPVRARTGPGADGGTRIWRAPAAPRGDRPGARRVAAPQTRRRPPRPSCCARASRRRRSPIPGISSTAITSRSAGSGKPTAAGVLPGLPWQASFGRTSGPAPELGADTETVLREVLDLSPDEIAALHRSGALG